MNYKRISEIILEYGYTETPAWILKSAIKNPNCIIVAGSIKEAKKLEYEYYVLLDNVSLFQKILWWLFAKEHPKFMAIQNDFYGYKLPIIFDISALQ